MLNKIIKGASIYGIGQITQKLLKALQEFLLAWLLGPAQYGIFQLAFIVFQLGHKISELGLPKTIVRFTPPLFESSNREDQKKLGQILLRSVLLAGVLSSVLALILYIFSDFLAVNVFGDQELLFPLKIILIAIPFVTLTILIAFFHRAGSHPMMDSLIQHVSLPFCWTLGSVGGYVITRSLEGAIIGFVAGNIVAFLVACNSLKRSIDLRDLLRGASTENSMPIYSFSLISWLITMGGLLLTRIDRLMLGSLSSSENVGVYSIAALLAAQTSFFLTSFNNIFSPRISSLYEQGRMEKLDNLFKTLSRWIFTLTIPLPVLFFGWGEALLTIPGDEYSKGLMSLVILALAFFMNCAVGSAGFILVMTSNHGLALLNSIIVNITNFVLNFVLISRYAMLGAALATGISIVFVNILRLTEVYFQLGLWPYTKNYWKPIFSVGLLSVIVFLFKDVFTWYLGLPIFYLTYLFIVFQLGLTENDQEILQRLKKNLVDT